MKVPYEDFNGVQQVKEACFHISKMELIRLVSSKEIDSEEITSILESNNNSKIFEYFEKIIGLSYGIKSEDGQRFIKNKQILEEFKQSPMYDAFMKSIMETGNATNFIKGLFPKDVMESVMKELEKSKNHNIVANLEPSNVTSFEDAVEKAVQERLANVNFTSTNTAII